jgi:hypothetical protein
MIRISAAVLSLVFPLVLSFASMATQALGNPDAPQGGTINIHWPSRQPSIRSQRLINTRKISTLSRWEPS